MNPVLPLRLALTANAVFSFSSGLLMVVRPSWVGDWLGIQAPLVLQIIGIGLAIFAGELFWQATRRRVATWRALIASAADCLWVAGSIGLLLFFAHLFSSSGIALILVVAGIVSVFGIWQLWGAGRAHRIAGSNEYRHCIVVETDVAADQMWQVIGDLGNIQQYMPRLKRSLVVDGRLPTVGAVRTCEDHAGKQWSEECTEFKPGRSFTVRFLTEDPDFPFPVKTMRGGWQVEPDRAGSDGQGFSDGQRVSDGQAGSQVMVWWELTPKIPLLAPIILPMLAFQADRDFPKVIRNMAAAAIQEHRSNQTRTANQGVRARLLPDFC